MSLVSKFNAFAEKVRKTIYEWADRQRLNTYTDHPNHLLFSEMTELFHSEKDDWERYYFNLDAMARRLMYRDMGREGTSEELKAVLQAENSWWTDERFAIVYDYAQEHFERLREDPYFNFAKDSPYWEEFYKRSELNATPVHGTPMMNNAKRPVLNGVGYEYIAPYEYER